MRNTIYTIDNFACDVGRNPLICDTGLLVAKFNPLGDDLREVADYILDQPNYDFLLPYSALVEAYHQCRKDPSDLLTWSIQPGKVILLPEDTASLPHANHYHALPGKEKLDLVDCLLLVYAQRIAQKIGSHKPVPIVTCDQRMIRKAKNLDKKFGFVDMKGDFEHVV